MSKIIDYPMSRKTKYFFSFKNNDGTAGNQNAGNFQVICNNTLLTNQQSQGGKPTKFIFNPILLTLDLKYFNVSSVLKNNQIRVTSTMFANSPIIVTIPDGYYNLVSLASTLQTRLIADVLFSNASLVGWLVEIQDATKIKIRYTGTFGTPAATTFDFVFNQTDSRSLFGFSSNSESLAYADRATGVTGNLAADLLPYNNLRICSKNLAKRFYVMKNGYLSNSDVLFEIPIIDYSLGSTVKFETTDTQLEQEINEFSTFDLMVKDENDQIIQFDSTAKLSINFSIQTEIFFQSPEEKLKNIQNYASYIS